MVTWTPCLMPMGGRGCRSSSVDNILLVALACRLKDIAGVYLLGCDNAEVVDMAFAAYDCKAVMDCLFP